MENTQKTDIQLISGFIAAYRKGIILTLLALSLTAGGATLSIEVDHQGATYQTTTYKFNFLGGFLN